MPRELLIFGAGGHGRVLADTARAAGWRLAGWADEDPAKRGGEVDGLPVLAGSVQQAADLCRRRGLAAGLGIGDNRARRNLCEALAGAEVELPAIVHPRAVISPSARLAEGAVVFAAAVLQPKARVGAGAIINTAATVDHDGDLGAFCHLSPGVHLGGAVTVGEGAHLGVGAAVRPAVTIGAWTVVGAGAAVVSDLPPGVIAYGVPARVRRRLDAGD